MGMKRRRKAAALLVLLACIAGCAPAQEPALVSKAESSRSTALEPEPQPEPEPVEPVYLLWPCFGSRTVSGESHTLLLENPEENTVPMRIMIQDLDTGATLYQSESIAPGEREVWDIYDAYQSGSHTVEVRCTALGEDGVTNTARQTIILTLS